MKEIARTAVLGFFLAIMAAIIFVQAGKQSGTSGGQQAAAVVNAGGSATSNVAAALESGQ